MFEGFRTFDIACGDINIHGRIGGSGPPLLLLHGHPQSHVIWHRLAEPLASRFTVVATDLRGYGDSSKPPGEPDHANYSKRAMAEDQVAVMRELGFERFQALLVGRVLDRCDAAVFARRYPDPVSADQDLTAAYEIVELSRPRGRAELTVVR